MNSFDFYSPTKFVFGKDREKEVGKYVKSYGGTKVLVITDAFIGSQKELMGKIEDSLKEEGLAYEICAEVQPNPRSGLVYKLINKAKAEKFDFMLAVGGGSSIDTSKAVAVGVNYDGDFWDFFSGKTLPEVSAPVGVILTIAASGSEGSADIIITNEETLTKTACEADCIRPKFAVMDPALTETLPPYQTACGVADIISHAMERYFSATTDNETTDRMLEGIMLAMLSLGKRVMKDPHDFQARANIMWAGMTCHNESMGVGRQQDWNLHHLEHVLSAYFPKVPHGAGIALLTPYWMNYCVEHSDSPKWAQFAVRVMGVEMDYENPKRTALEGVVRYANFLKEIGMPSTFEELHCDPAAIPELVKMNHVNGAAGAFVPLDEAAHYEIYERAAGVYKEK